MALRLKLSGPAGAGLPQATTFSDVENAAFDAMTLAGMKSILLPTYIAPRPYARTLSGAMTIQDAAAPLVEYAANAAGTGPGLTGTAAAPGLSWVGVAGPRGVRNAVYQPIEGYADGVNPSQWVMVCATPGAKDGSVQYIGGVMGSELDYGQGFLTSGNLIRCRVGSDTVVSIPTQTSLDWNEPARLGLSYSAVDGQISTYLNGVSNSVALAGGTQLRTGGIAAGGRGTNLITEVFDATGSRVHCIVAGNGILTAEHASAIDAWMAATWG